MHFCIKTAINYLVLPHKCKQSQQMHSLALATQTP